MRQLNKCAVANAVISPMLVLFLGLMSCAAPSPRDGLIETVVQIEHRLDARIGVAVFDMETGRRWEYHADDRFPLNSTFKTLVCVTLLARVDAGQERLDRVVTFNESTLVTYSPVLEMRIGPDGIGRMTLAEACEATMSMSDNSAANLILDAIGGPAALTEFVRSIGDDVTRLDRRETDLNEAVPGDVRDTTTPNAMAMNLKKLVLGDVLSQASRQQLEDWLVGNKVGDALLRAGVPHTWKVGDRTGAGGYGSRSITAIMWPPGNEPVIAAIYITETNATFDERNAAIAEIGEAIAARIME